MWSSDEPGTSGKSYRGSETEQEAEMGDVVVTEFVSLDGVMEDPGGSEDFEHGGWSFKFDRGDDGDRFKLDEVMQAGAHLLGRVTYEGFADAWPSRSGEFADKINAMPKYVVSTTLEEADWTNSTVISGDLASEIPRLKRDIDGDLLVAGSQTLAQALTEQGLVDEYRLMVFPVVLGSGRRLFGELADPAVLELVDSKPVGPDGVLVLTYHPARTKPQAAGS
jgi:dihydrofolate reductase